MTKDMLKTLWILGTSLAPRVAESDRAALRAGGWIDSQDRLTEAGQDYLRALAY